MLERSETHLTHVCSHLWKMESVDKNTVAFIRSGEMSDTCLTHVGRLLWIIKNLGKMDRKQGFQPTLWLSSADEFVSFDSKLPFFIHSFLDSLHSVDMSQIGITFFLPFLIFFSSIIYYVL